MKTSIKFFNAVNGDINEDDISVVDKVANDNNFTTDIIPSNTDDIEQDKEVERPELINQKEMIEYEREQTAMIQDDSLEPMNKKSKIKQV